MRELVRLFEMPESVDDLALGQFRTVISNELFPGTSVLHVAARYLLLVPWCFQTAASRGRTGDELRASAEQTERRLIRRLQQLESGRFIGSGVGDRVAQLPSAAYWSALREWGIIRSDVDRNSIGESVAGESDARREGIDVDPIWHRGLPPAPAGFPATEERGIELTREEAEWIRERVLATVRGTLLAHLVADPAAVDAESHTPWADVAARKATGNAQSWLHHAEAYSALSAGLQAVYADLITAEKRRHFGGSEDEASNFADEWWQDDYHRQQLRDWDIEGFIGRARTINSRIRPQSTAFLRGTTAEFLSGRHPRENDALARMIRSRERLAKGANARFVNDRRLRAWRPPEKVGIQTYRWIQVRRMMTDLAEGLDRA